MNNYILNAVILSSLVYNNPNTISIPGLAPLLVITDTKTDTHGLVMVDTVNKTLYICFRGTADERNVFTDIECTQTKVEIIGHEVMIHDGFLKAFESVQKEVLDFSFDAYKDYSVVVCGHSLGAALATICACTLNIPNNIYVVTCGSPRVGDNKFVSLFNERVSLSYRFIYCDDVVPSIPRINYEHTKTGIRLDQNGKEIKYYNILTRFISWVKTCKNLSFKLYIIDDHFMAGYINSVTIWTKELLNGK